MPSRPHDRPIKVHFRPALRARRGKLLTGAEGDGVEVHAGSFLRSRDVVLDSYLLAQPRELARILVHELYHFVWLRLDNTTRNSYEAVVSMEFRQRASGELGWSAERLKERMTTEDRRRRTRRWREYLSESFCDTAAWLFGGARRHNEFTLAPVHRRRRRTWFREAEALRRIAL